MIGPPADELGAAVEDVLRRILEGALAGATPASEDAPADTAPGVTNSRGLGSKYHVVRLDGSDVTGAKHHGCSLFVLDLTHDPAARAALIAYCAAARVSRPQLVAELIKTYLEE